uniref:F-box/LRR-repeat protein 13 n=1 Tax=Bactrocera latifrons TaxID=174628 RepID=A0A0K8VKI9_BACLA
MQQTSNFFITKTMESYELKDKDYRSWKPSYGELPMEIIQHIFRFLSFPDVQVAGKTCQRWREASFNTEFSTKNIIRFSKVCLSDRSSPAKDFLMSNRPFRNYHFEEVTFGPIKNIMSHIGNTAEEIIFDNVDVGDKQFYAIMSLLPKIRAITITRCSPLFMSGSFLDNIDDRLSVCINFCRIQDLSLKDNQYLSDAILLRITEMMHSINTLDLSGCHIAYHNAIQRRFYPNDVDVTPSESILTFKFIMSIISMHHQNLRSLNLSNTLISPPSLIALSDLSFKGFLLQNVGLANCRQVNNISLQSFLKKQNKLLTLDLSGTICVNDSCIDVIVKNLPLLQELNISGCINITNNGSSLLGELKYLKSLNVSRCDGIQSEGLTNGVAAKPNATLLYLQMAHLQVCEEAIMVLAQNLPELRVLNLSHCVNGVTDESVQCIIQNLRWLRDLSLENCFRITDVALTGINISQVVLGPNSQNSIDKLHQFSLSSLAEGYISNDSNHSIKISLRSKAEEDIVRDAIRKKAMVATYEMNSIRECDMEGYSIKELQGLKSLYLGGCNKISDVSLKYGLKFVELQNLSLSNCQQISLTGIEQMVHACPSIETLDLSDCESINDKAIQLITVNLTRLRALHINGCSQLTDHTLDAILVNCKNLQTLSIHRCRRIYTDIEDRLSEMSTLRDLEIDNSSNIDNACLLRLKKRLDY